MKREATDRSILSASAGRIRKKRLSADEESLIADAIIEFQNNSNLLDSDCLRGMVQTFVKTFDVYRRRAIGLKDYRPGAYWIT